ncbi:MAG: hypothetical protein ABIQ11_05710, partial [Saprospiraceae bacterium]
MRFSYSLLALCLVISFKTSAEGTREMAPNGSIIVNGNSTTDLAALHINNFAFNSFASYNNPNPNSRLYIHIKDPSKECIFLGFSFGHPNENTPFPSHVSYQYRILDPAGNIVFGPVMVGPDGNILNWSQGFNGPQEIHGAGGYDAVEATAADLSSQGWTGAGDYYIEFQNTGGTDFLIDFWDITVADCSTPSPTEKKGRVWSYNWSIFAINDFGFPFRPFNGAFYVCAPDPSDPDAAFITRIDFNGSGFQPAAFNVAFNSFGVFNTGNIAEDRRSVQDINATQAEYAIFLNDPIELCKTAIVGEITLDGISRCDAGDYCIKFTSTKEGQIDILLDFDGNDNMYTPGTRDVLITVFVLADQVGVPTCIPWNGIDGFGLPMNEDTSTTIPILLSFAQGIYHFPIFDAELMLNGFRLQAVRPAATIPLLHYDDSNIQVPSGSGEPPVQITGCNVPCHRWTTFVNNGVPGFGNLHTINSWWFSQRIVREDVLLLPAYYTCAIDGPQRICSGSSTQIIFQPQVHPGGLQGPEILSTVWEGPGIVGANTGNEITIDAAGHYTLDVVWINGTGDTCETSCDYNLLIDPPLVGTIDTLILEGTTIVINGAHYSDGGQFVQFLESPQGCDSILTINVQIINSVIHYDLDACLSFMSDGSHMDYSEFTAAYPQPLSCADISASILHRDPPAMNKHSCTEGVNNSIAMCISSLDTCDYDAGNQASLVFSVTITPDPDTAVQITGISFFEKAPLTYSWISGGTGPNNYPTLFGLRVLRNGTEIFRQEDIPTNSNWTERIFDFIGNVDFITGQPVTFQFELLPYCLIGNGEEVNAWDIDELFVQASCVSLSALNKAIAGDVVTPKGKHVKDVQMRIAGNAQFIDQTTELTDADGHYVFPENRPFKGYHISGYKNTNFINGVSTLDLIYIQKHLLGFAPFTSPYQFVAADANRSHSVTAIDLIEFKKLLLGFYDVLPKNTSWRFGNALESYEGSYPWGFKETIEIEYLLDHVDDAHFVGVKIGDINGDVKTDLNGIISSRTNDALNLVLQVPSKMDDQPLRMDVIAEQFKRVAGMQFGLELSDLTIIEVISGSLHLSSDQYKNANGVFNMSWTSVDPVTIADGQVLFSLIVKPEGLFEVEKMIRLSNQLIAP